MCPAVSEAPVWADSEVVVVVEGSGEAAVTLTIGRLGTRLHFARSNFSRPRWKPFEVDVSVRMSER